MDNYDYELVAALSRLSPLARTKIRATLADFTTEITSGAWASLFAKKNRYARPQPCGCLMMDGYFKEHPLDEDDVDWDDVSHTWLLPNDEWIDELIPFYEMQGYEGAGHLIGEAANAYDEWVRDRNTAEPKIVRGVHVLRVPARRRLIKLVDKAST